MTEWIRSALDLALILMVGAGLVQATRLIRHLSGLRQGRMEMERFVHDFNAAVNRAEAGIRNLRQAARESGDDLEKLVGQAVMVRDELHFLVESADQIANRLSHAASQNVRPETKQGESSEAATPQAKKPVPPLAQVTPINVRKQEAAQTPAPSSRAERDLLQALQKLS